jgi:hypothetical protein
VLLDHEVIHWGDPAFDLGFALTHLISKARHMRPGGRFTIGALDFWSAYCKSCGQWIKDDPGAESRIIRHTLACMLARVAGRSPLEYLSDAERAEQQRDVLFYMRDMPATTYSLILALAMDDRRIDDD